MFNWLIEIFFGHTEKSFKKMSLKQQTAYMKRQSQGKGKGARVTRQRNKQFKKDMKKRGW